MKNVIFIVTMLLVSAPSFAADCSLIYDEFHSLMNKEFLLNPGKYVAIQANRISRQDYNTKQKGKFLLNNNNQGLGIAIVHSNKNTWGKFLYTWEKPLHNGHPSLIIKEAILYGRVKDGYRPRTWRDIKIQSSYSLDLDTGRSGGNGADIWFHNIDGREMYLEAINGASLTFPLQSLCKPSTAQIHAISTLRPAIAQLQLATAKPKSNPAGGKQVLKREILPNGHVLITYADGSKIERYQGGQTITAADGTESVMLFSTAAPVAIPVSPPSSGERAWLDYHRAYLLGIIESLVADPNLVEQYIKQVDNSNNIYTNIANRSQIIQQLILP